jgi:cellulose synthase/poly-beta-1,6-N-acetylglucosamine synthase-like glycosyltransferase
MIFLKIIFWFSLAVLFYCYIGYGLLLYVYNQLKAFVTLTGNKTGFELLPITLIVAAYNEEKVLVQKIKNCLEIDYPRDRLQIIFITDGSTDNSVKMLSGHEYITLLHQSKREGKFEALKRAMRFVKTPVVVFSDANSMLNANCLKAVVRHYANEDVGGVAGEKKILPVDHSSIVGQAEGLYWKYESFMKRQDGCFNTVVGAAGELFSMRTELFHAPDVPFILDDLVFSMQVCLQGFKIEYEPGAFAVETPSMSLADEEKRKIRIAAGAYQSMPHLRQCLNIFRFPLLTIQYFSRRLLRWIASPLLLFIAFIANVELVVNHQGFIFDCFLISQIFFYLLAVVGRLFVTSGWRISLLSLPFYITFMNFCLVKGFVIYLQGRETVLWEKSIREAIE